ncbi:hypothetical protein HDU84_006613 [Entophlyctis sp. JEL0112]|nr:hypothetical protein HDU84_006613 [Entophlyctis sp. JEL0112]
MDMESFSLLAVSCGGALLMPAKHPEIDEATFGLYCKYRASEVRQHISKVFGLELSAQSSTSVFKVLWKMEVVSVQEYFTKIAAALDCLQQISKPETTSRAMYAAVAKILNNFGVISPVSMLERKTVVLAVHQANLVEISPSKSAGVTPAASPNPFIPSRRFPPFVALRKKFVTGVPYVPLPFVPGQEAKSDQVPSPKRKRTTTATKLAAKKLKKTTPVSSALGKADHAAQLQQLQILSHQQQQTFQESRQNILDGDMWDASSFIRQFFGAPTQLLDSTRTETSLPSENLPSDEFTEMLLSATLQAPTGQPSYPRVEAGEVTGAAPQAGFGGEITDQTWFDYLNL